MLYFWVMCGVGEGREKKEIEWEEDFDGFIVGMVVVKVGIVW